MLITKGRDAYLLEVKGVDVKNVLVGVGGIGQEIRAVGIPRRLVQVIVLLHQPLQLCLNVGNLLLRELVFIELNPRCLEVLQVPQLARKHEEQRAPFLAGSGSTANSVNVLLMMTVQASKLR